MSKPPRHRRPLIEALEPRLLFSATADIAVFDDGSSDAQYLAQAAEQVDLASIYLPAEPLIMASSDDGSDTTSLADTPIADTSSATASPITSVVFVDTAVADYESIVDDLRKNTDASEVMVVYLDPQKDGVGQITAALAQYSNLSAIHIISHGSAGAVELGTTTLSDNTLFQYEDDLLAWGKALGDDADILFYGCDVAIHPAGQTLIDRIAQLTAADVAASEDITGHTSLGGDWDLEYKVGDIDTPALVSAELQQSFVGVMAATHYINIQGGSSTQAVTSGANVGQTFSYDSSGATYTVNQISVQLMRTAGAANQDITIQLLDGGWGDASPLASRTITFDKLGTAFSWETVNFGDVALNKNQTYIVRISSSGSDGNVLVGYSNSDIWIGPDMIVSGVTDSSSDLKLIVSYNDGTNQQSVNTVPGAQVTGQNTPLVFSSANGNQIQISDADAFPNDMEITLAASNGTLTLGQTTGLTFNGGDGTTDYFMRFQGSVSAVNAALATITYTPALGVTGSDTFTITSKDIGLNGVDTVSNIGITVYNSLNTVPGAQSVNEDTTLQFSAAGSNQIQVADPGGLGMDTSNVKVTLSVSNGLLTLGSTAGVTFTSGDGTSDGSMVFNGTLANVNAVLSTVNYVPTSNYNGSSMLTILSEAGSSGGPLTDSDSITITVNAVNDAPTLDNVISDQSVQEGSSLNFTIPANTFADPEGGALTYSATLVGGAPLPAWLQLNSTTGAFTGVPDDGDVGTLNIRVTATDTGSLTVFDDFTLTVTQLNEAPFILNPIANQVASGFTPFTYQFPHFNEASPVFGDPDVGDSIVSYRATLADGSALSTTGWLSFDSATRTFSGTPTNANAGTITVRLYATDNDGLESPPDEFNIVISASANDAPVNTVPGAQSTNEDTALVFTGATQIQIADADALSSSVQVTLSVSNGVLTLGGTTGLSFTTGDGTSDATLVFTGSVANINTALSTLTYTPNSHFNGADTLSIVTNDLGNSGTGGAQSDTDTVNITVNAVNDAPTVAITPTDYYVNEQTWMDLHGTGISVADIDGNPLTITITGAGSNSNFGATAGATGVNIVSGINTNTLVLTGTAAQLNDLFAGNNGGTLTYRLSGDTPVATRLLTISASDGSLSGNDTATINITAVNDAPINTVPGAQTMTEGGTLVFSSGNGNLIEIEDYDAAATNIEVTLSVTNGTLTLAGTTGLSFITGDGTADATLVFRGSQDDINDALNGLTFNPAANYSGGEVLTITTSDLGNSGSGGTLTDTDTVNITVNAVNDAPSGNDNTLTINEGGSHTFTAANFGFSDATDSPANTLLAVHIASLPAVGSLTLNGAAVTMGQSIAVADINSGLLVFTPAANASGASYASFTFQVQDNGGTANGGVNLDPSANTITLDVTAVNDAPSGTDNTLTLNEDASHTFTAANFGFSDATDSPANSLMAVTIASLPAAGSLTLNGAAVTMGQSIAVADINSGLLVFTPAANASGAGYSSFTFQVQDNGGTANGGVNLDPSANTITLDVTAVNDAPSGTDNTLTLNEDASHTFTAANFGFSDATDSPANSLMAVTIASLPAAGSLTLSGAAVIMGQSITVADINAGLLVFTPAANASGAGYSSFTFQVQDNGGTANGGVNLDPSANTITLDVTGVNDAPAVNITLVDYFANEQTAVDLHGTGISISDIDSSNITLTIAGPGPNSQLTANAGTTGVSIFSGNGTPSLVLIGTLTQLNDFLAGNNGGTLTYRLAGDTPAASVTLTITANDGALTGNDTATINITAVNDAPVNTVPGAQVTNEGTALVFNAGNSNQIQIGDADVAAGNLQVTLSVTNGTLTLAGITGLAFTTGDGSADTSMVFTGTLADINAALADLTYNPTANYSGGDVLTITTSDLGNSGSGGTLTDTDTVNITVDAVNDAPSGSDNTLTINEDASHTFTAANFGFSDATDSPANSLMAVTIASLPAAGSLTLSGGAVAPGQSITVADINAGLLVFTPAANASGAGYSSFTFQVQDNGGTANGGVDLDASANTITIDVSAVNDAPTVAMPIGIQNATEDALFNFTFGAGTFTDAELNSLSYSAQLAGGGLLPGWLDFDEATRTFSGTPINSDVGTLSIEVTANDGNGGTVTDTFNLLIANANDAPTVAIPIPDRIANEASSFNFQFPIGTFTDVDAGDTLTYTATINGGGAWPGWLTFDDVNRTFSGVPMPGDIGVLTIDVTAEDPTGATVTDTFTITVNAASDIEYIDSGTGGQISLTTPVGQSFSYNSVGATYAVNEISLYLARYADADPQNITVELRDAWNGALLASDSIASSQISGDGFGWHTFSFANVALNDSQTYVIQVSTDGVDGKVLYSKVGGNVFPDGVFIENGVPDAGGWDLAFKVSKDDGSNTAPLLDYPIADQTIDAEDPFNLVVPANTFSDPDPNDTITYRAQLAGGGSMGWLQFNESTKTFWGTPHWHQAGTISIELIATDNHGGSTSAFFDIEVINTNIAPTVAQPIPDQTVNEDSLLNFAFDINTFTDVDVGQTFTYTAELAVAGGMPPWLSFDQATRTFSGTPDNDDVGTWTIEVTANDGFGGTVTTSFDIVVANTNDAPTVANPIPDQNATETSAFSFTFNSDVFNDEDVGDVLTYSATSNSGALPGWLSFNGATRTFSGTPPVGTVGTLNIEVMANDGNGGLISDAFVITIAPQPPNVLPVVQSPIADQSVDENQAFGFTLPAGSFTDPDGDTLTYTAQLAGGASLPSWLSFNAATGTFSGTPTASDIGIINVQVTATDSRAGSVSDSFVITINNVNDAPVLAIAPADQTATANTPFSVSFPANMFTDADAGTVLTYTATQANGAPLPGWLTFNAGTLSFSGTPTNADVGSLSISLVASDGTATATAAFELTVVSVNEAPQTSGTVAIHNLEDAAGDQVDLWATFSDAETASSALVYSIVSNSNPSLVTNASIDVATGKLQLNYGVNQSGSADLMLRAQDEQGAWVETLVRINIDPVNDTPVSGSIADMSVQAGAAPQQLDLKTVFSDVENGTALIWTLMGNTNSAVANAQIDPATGAMTVSFAPQTGGDSTITLRAQDAEGAWVETSFKVSVAQSPVTPPIEPPVIPPVVIPPVEPPIEPPVVPVDPVIPPVTVPPVTPPTTEIPVTNPPEGTGGDGDDTVITPPSVSGAGQPLVVNLDTEQRADVTLDDKSSRDIERAEVMLSSNNVPVTSLTASPMLAGLISPDAGFAPWEEADFDSEVRRLRAQMDEAMEEEQDRRAVVAGITFSVTTGLLVWSLRASSLLLTMMSMLPLWRGLDPLPILDEVNKRKKELEEQRKDREREDKSAKEVGYLFDHAQRKESRS